MQAADSPVAENITMSFDNYKRPSLSEEYDSTRDGELSDTDLEMPPDFAPDYSVGDISSHITQVKMANGITDIGGDIPDGTGSLSNPMIRYIPICINPQDHINDEEYFLCKSHSCSELHCHLTSNQGSPSSHSLPTLCIPRVGAPKRHASNNSLECNIVINQSEGPCEQSDREYYSDQSHLSGGFDEDDEFGDFSAFPSTGQPPTESPIKPQNTLINGSADDFANFEAFDTPKVLPPQHPAKDAFVKNILVHSQTALEAAFSVDSKSHIKTFLPSQSRAPVDIVPLKIVFSRLWSKESFRSVQRTWDELTSNSAPLYKWNSSSAYTFYLKAIGVDFQSNCFMAPPTARLKLLEPTPFPTSTQASTPPSQPTPNGTNSNDIKEPPNFPPIPKFNWSDNSMISTQNSDTPRGLSEVDFELFEGMSSKPSVKPPSDLEAEFLTPVAPPATHPPFALVGAIQSPAERPEAELPTFVREALARLPDFTYTRQTVLAFPVPDETRLSPTNIDND